MADSDTPEMMVSWAKFHAYVKVAVVKEREKWTCAALHETYSHANWMLVAEWVRAW